MQQCFGLMQKNEEKVVVGNKKIIRIVWVKGLDLQGNSLMPILKVAVMKMKSKSFSTTITVSHN